MQLTHVSSGSQLLLYSSLLILFKVNYEFIFEICKVGRIKKKRLSHGK